MEVAFCLFFFFKQKTAYEMRISDWSSDVCSSDLRRVHRKDQVGNAAMLGCVRFGPDQAKDHVGLLGGAGPDLLAIDNKFAVFDVRAGLEVGEVRPGTG